MLKNYFRIARRNLVKHRLYSIVNLTGLTLGITACMLIGFYVWNETSYDGFHKNADRIVRVTMEYRSSGTLSREFMVMVTIAIFIAIPISWYTGSTWLQDFAYRININGKVFISAAVIAIIIAIISVGIQAFKAATANPVKSLRTE